MQSLLIFCYIKCNMDKKVKQETLKATELSIKTLRKIEKLNNSILSPIDGIIVESNVQQGSLQVVNACF